MGFPKRLRELRLDRGLTQQQLADPLYTSAFVSTLEAGRRHPSRKALGHFAQKLGVSPEELETGVSPLIRAATRTKLQDGRRLISEGELESAEALIGEVRDIAKAHDWTLELGQALTFLALAAEQGGQIDRAIQLYDSAEMTLSGSSLLGRVDALAGRTRCLQIKGDVRYAVHLLETHLRLLREAGLEDPNALARIYASLIAAYFDAGLQRQAEAAAQKVLELVPLVEEPDRLANMHINTARVLFQQGDFDEARRSYERAEELYIGLDWKNDLGRVHLARSFSLIAEGQLSEAVTALQKAMRMFNETGHKLNATRCALQLAKVLRIRGQTAEARMQLRNIQLGGDGGAAEQGIARRELGLCLAQEGSISEADGRLKEAIELFESAEDTRELALTYRVLGDLMRDAKELSGACDAYRNAAMALENAA